MSQVSESSIKGCYRVEDPDGNGYRVLQGPEIQRRVNAYPRLVAALQNAEQALRWYNDTDQVGMARQIDELLSELEASQ